MSRRAALLLLASAGMAPPAWAQGDCFPPKNSNEARTMAKFSVPLAFTGGIAPSADPVGMVRIGLEGAWIPEVDRATATPTICRPGKGPENTDLLIAVPRPRVAVALPGGLTAEGSWIPPFRLAGVEANLVGLGLARVTRLGGGAAFSIRAHATLGRVLAPITCDDDALQDPSSECYQGTRSDDSFKPNILGLEAAVGWPLGPRLRPYLGAGWNRLAPRFQVNFTSQAGNVDRRKVEVDLDRAALFAGATWQAGGRLELTGEVYSAPSDAVTGRVVGRLRLGGGR